MIRPAATLAVLLAAAALQAQPRFELRLGPTEVETHGILGVPLYLDSTEEVEGFVAVFEWDAGATGNAGMVFGELFNHAGPVSMLRAEANYFVFAIVMDDAGASGKSIPPGNGILVGTMHAPCLAAPATFRFADFKYSAWDGGPLLENYVIVGGRDIAASQGLILTGTELRDCIPNTANQRVPGDCNSDGHLDIADGVCVLGVLFLGDPAAFPCGLGTSNEEGNRNLLDWQPDGQINIADAVAIFLFLFVGAAPHPLAVPGNETRGCAPIAGCADFPACP